MVLFQGVQELSVLREVHQRVVEESGKVLAGFNEMQGLCAGLQRELEGKQGQLEATSASLQAALRQQETDRALWEQEAKRLEVGPSRILGITYQCKSQETLKLGTYTRAFPCIGLRVYICLASKNPVDDNFMIISCGSWL